MKNYILLLLCSFSFSIFAQNDSYIGTYEKKINGIGGEIFIYKLEINADHTFTYHLFRNIGQSSNVDENYYGKGTWKQIKNVIYFHTNNETDIDEKYTLNFTNSTGRYDAKNKTLFRFYRSQIAWIKKSTLTKID